MLTFVVAATRAHALAEAACYDGWLAQRYRTAAVRRKILSATKSGLEGGH
jgi:hypothetical protein